MTRFARFAAVAATLLLSTLLVACGGPSDPSASESPSPSSSGEVPDPDPTTEAVDHPVPGFGDGCAALVPTSLITAISPDANTPHDFLATEYAAYPSVPRNAPIAQVGGLLCEWSNGEPYSSAVGTSGFRGIQLAVLPDAAEGWIEFTTYYDLDPLAGQVTCWGTGFCTIDIFESGYWFNVEAAVTETPGTLADIQALADHLRREALGFGAADDPWMPAGHRAVPNDCEITLPAGIVDEIFGAGHTLLDNNDGGSGGGWSIWATAIQRNSDSGCGWFNESQGLGFVSLNGGAWLAAGLGASVGTPLPLAGLADDDSATIACGATGCTVTVLVAGNWVEASVNGSPDDSAAATRLAAHLVEVVRG